MRSHENNEHLETDETSSLIAASKVEGTDVYNKSGEHLGEVEEVMIDKVSGKVAYAVVEFGGFLGIGEQKRALPWSVLTYDTSQDGYVVNAEQDVIAKSPEYNDQVDFSNKDWGSRLHEHYGVTPYWNF